MTIYAISIATNLNKAHNIQLAMQTLNQFGVCQMSSIYEIPCRDGVGADYWNCACLVESEIDLNNMTQNLKQLELETGRKRPSHQISLDLDLIAWGESLDDMQFNPKKLPLAQDVVIPMLDVWVFQKEQYIHHYLKYDAEDLMNVST